MPPVVSKTLRRSAARWVALPYVPWSHSRLVELGMSRPPPRGTTAREWYGASIGEAGTRGNRLRVQRVPDTFLEPFEALEAVGLEVDRRPDNGEPTAAFVPIIVPRCLERLPLASSGEMAASGDFDSGSVGSYTGKPAGTLAARGRCRRSCPAHRAAQGTTPASAAVACTLERTPASRLIRTNACNSAGPRRASAPPPALRKTSKNMGSFQLGSLTIDIDRCEVARDGTYVPLTASEFRIVAHMARNVGRVLRPARHPQCCFRWLSLRPREAQDVFKVFVRRIRRKLETSENEPQFLVTVRGLGYRLEGTGTGIRTAIAQTA